MNNTQRLLTFMHGLIILSIGVAGQYQNNDKSYLQNIFIHSMCFIMMYIGFRKIDKSTK